MESLGGDIGNNRGRWISGLLVLFFLIFNIAVAVAGRDWGDHSGFIFLGVAFAQTSMLAMWTALGTAPLVIRSSLGLVGAVFVSISVLAYSTYNYEGLAIGGATFLQWCFVQLPLWACRLFSDWRFSTPPSAPESDSRSDTQFGIRQLLVWTGLVAAVLALARTAFPAGAAERGGGDYRTLLGILGLLPLFSSLLAWPTIWGTLVRRGLPIWLFTASLCFVGICIAESWAFQTISGIYIDAFWWMNGVQFGVSAIALLLLRLSGLRLIRDVGEKAANEHG